MNRSTDEPVSLCFQNTKNAKFSYKIRRRIVTHYICRYLHHMQKCENTSKIFANPRKETRCTGVSLEVHFFSKAKVYLLGTSYNDIIAIYTRFPLDVFHLQIAVYTLETSGVMRYKQCHTQVYVSVSTFTLCFVFFVET